jgi:hypothetical protein
MKIATELSINKEELELITRAIESYLYYDMRDDISMNVDKQKATMEDIYSKLIVLNKLESKLNIIQSDYNKPFTLMTYKDSYGEVFHDVCTNDPKKYLKRLNEDRIADGEEEENISSYTLTDIHIETFKNK